VLHYPCFGYTQNSIAFVYSSKFRDTCFIARVISNLGLEKGTIHTVQGLSMETSLYIDHSPHRAYSTI
jgi:lysophospholipid acyltransferase (LPLAT)-like uncharacterized protein